MTKESTTQGDLEERGLPSDVHFWAHKLCSSEIFVEAWTIECPGDHASMPLHTLLPCALQLSSCP